MDSVKLLKRTDTKYVFGAAMLPTILERVKEHYRILEVSGTRANRYRTLYYDTPNFKFHRLHQNGKSNRFKVRFRKYVDSSLTFLEIKFKNNKKKTVKSRIKVDDFDIGLTKPSEVFIKEVMGYKEDLVPKLWNTFTRITLVSLKDTERLTIDLNLGFEFDDNVKDLSHVVIAEVKQEKASRNSNFVRTVKDLGIRPTGMSKYCIGATLLYPNLKHNNFKEKLLTIKKLRNDRVPV